MTDVGIFTVFHSRFFEVLGFHHLAVGLVGLAEHLDVEGFHIELRIAESTDQAIVGAVCPKHEVMQTGRLLSDGVRLGLVGHISYEEPHCFQFFLVPFLIVFQ